MKIIIATRTEMGFDENDIASGKCPGYQPLFCDDVRPEAIRKAIEAKLATEEYNRAHNPGAKEYKHVTMNRTVLDMVQYAGSKNNYGISYEDCEILIDGRLIPLLEWRSEAWLSLFALGDVINRYL